MNYYVRTFSGKKVAIDFDRGLGRFLKNSGVLDNRVIVKPGGKFNLLSGVTYRRYVFQPDTFRFSHDLEFTYVNARVDHEESTVTVVKPSGFESIHAFVWLGLLPPEEGCLNVILSGKSWTNFND